jgi:hypothetical protein
MSVSVSIISTEEMLNIIRPGRHLAVWRGGDKVEYVAVESDEALMALPNMSLRVASVKARPLNVQPPQDIMQHPRVEWLADVVGHPPAVRVFEYVFNLLGWA